MKNEIPPLVLVTGITGFLGSHCAKQLLAEGFRVRGTVRSLANKLKVAHIHKLQTDFANSLELIEADLNSPEKWNLAVSGCDFVLHVASPFPAKIPKDPNDVIKPAVNGALHVLQAIATDPNKTVKRVVLTSSIASIFSGRDQMEKIWTENDWSIMTDPKRKVDPYPASKLLAEKAAWDFVEKLPKNKSFELTVICPGLICGPYLGGVAGTSAETCARLLKNEIPAVPNMIFPGVDVRDVAKAHIKAMLTKGAEGRRFICISFDFDAREVAKFLAEEFNQQGFNVTQRHLPNWLLSIISQFDSSLKAILPHIGVRPKFDIQATVDILGIKDWIDVKKSCIDQSYSLIELGIVPDRRN